MVRYGSNLASLYTKIRISEFKKLSCEMVVKVASILDVGSNTLFEFVLFFRFKATRIWLLIACVCVLDEPFHYFEAPLCFLRDLIGLNSFPVLR